jgi:hypothetical protein
VFSLHWFYLDIALSSESFDTVEHEGDICRLAGQKD